MSAGCLATEIFSGHLPKLQPCSRVALARGEVVIHAAGFEDRTMAIAEVLAPGSSGIAVLLDYLPHNSENRLSDVQSALSARGVIVSGENIIQYHRFKPNDFELRLRERLELVSARRILLDISTMSKLAIILVLGVCRSMGLATRIFYAEAAIYSPTEEEFESAREKREIHRPSLQVFTGVHGVVRVDSLASVAMQGQPTAALVFMSFNDALTQVLLNTVYPSRLFLINSRPPIHAWREKATAWIHDQVRREWERDNPVYPQIDGFAMPMRTAPTLDYRDTVLLLLRLYWELSANHRLLLAPAGSKMQTVGCFLVKALHPDIHIEYPSPEGFARDYSLGIGHRWLLDLDDLGRCLEVLAEAERQKFLEIPG